MDLAAASAKLARSPVVGLIGLLLPEDVAGSLTEIGDERQLALSRRVRRGLRRAGRDPDPARLRPKAVRRYCAIIGCQLSQRDRLTTDLAQQLVERSRASLRQLPVDEVQARGGRHARGATAADG